MTTGTLLRRFAPYFKRYKWLVMLDLLCASLTTLCELVLPKIVSFITDTGVKDLSALTTSVILRCGALYLVLRVIDSAAGYYMTSIGHRIGVYIETDMRRDLFHHLQQLSFAYYSKNKIGQIMARITGDLFEVTEFAHHCPEEFLIATIKTVVAFIMIARMNILLALVIFIALPVMLVVAAHFNTKMKAGFRENRVQVGEINARVEDSLLGIRVVKSFTNEELEEEKFAAGNEAYKQLKTKIYSAMAGLHTTTRTFDGVMYIVVVVLGAFFMRNGRISPGDLVAALLYVSMLLTTIRRIVEFAEQFQKGVTGIERFIQIMDAPLDVRDAPDARELTRVRGEVTLDHISFAYPDQPDNLILNDITLHVDPGKRVAFVGPSGAGKTTLCHLIPRFYDVTAGKILIDGQDVRCVTQRSLRHNIGMVQQDVYLFTGTVADNIGYGKPGAERAEIEEAARRAHAHDFIMALPNGYDTDIGERGMRLSGGQKQRLSIARAFLKDPPILILDEATSALDNESERAIQQSLEELSQGRTTFTVAHRLSTIRRADAIWVITDEGIVEHGTHDELLVLNGLYAQMYNA